MHTRKTRTLRVLCAPAGPALLVVLAVGVWFWTGCAPRTEAQRKWLSVFFDGVPGSGPTNTAKRVQVGRAAGDATNVARAEARKLPPSWQHRPYANRQCDLCHASLFSQKLLTEARDLCFRCHKDFLRAATFTHAPAASGDCLVCHHAHRATENFGLLRGDRQLCLDCHWPSEVCPQAEKAGAKTACQTCHDPHQSDRPFLLRTPVPPPTLDQT